MHDLDLYYNKYTEEELANNIHSLYVKTIIKTQDIKTIKFVNDYLLNSNYWKNDNEDDITLNYIVLLNPCLKSQIKHKNLFRT
jgi:hypothetical protein